MSHKKKRQALFDQQNGHCALCGQPIPAESNQACLYEPGNCVVCRSCNTVIANYRHLKQPGGVTVADVEAFLIREPAPEPAPKPAPAKPFKPSMKERARLEARLAAARGQISRMTLADYDKRFGTSGPVIDPDTGLEWAGTNTD